MVGPAAIAAADRGEGIRAFVFDRGVHCQVLQRGSVRDGRPNPDGVIFDAYDRYEARSRTTM